MADRLHLSRKHRRILETLLREHLPDVEVWAYGSRVNGRSHDGSDLDLVLRGPGLEEIPVGRLNDFWDAVSESLIPFLVEARDWARLPDRFRREIESQHLELCAPCSHPSCRWQKARLGDVIRLRRGHDLPKRLRVAGSFPVVSSSGISDSHAKAKVQGPGVIIGRYGTLGEVHFVRSDYWPLNTTLYVEDFKGNDPRYVSYLLETLDVSPFSDKAAVPGLNRNHLHEAEVPFAAPAAEQRAIAHILGTLDDKIELNRRMNETLQAMARALFSSWFVDFEPVRAKMAGRDTGLTDDIAELFPSRLTASARGEIPSAWRVMPLGECFKLTMGQSPPGTSYNDIGEGLPFFQGRTDFGFRFPAIRRFCTAPSRIARSDETLVSVRAPVGDINMAWAESCIGRGIAALRHHSLSSTYTYYAVSAIHRDIAEFEHSGTVFGAITRKQFESLEVIEPDPATVRAFDLVAGPMDRCIRLNETESRNLILMRQALLPKLISGELRVTEAVEAMQDATGRGTADV
ncbi:MAG: restriction endonuclease subunit S [Gammaproteobacteria bacterium]|nr:restriction endonuclease subunit S [Gammaproteobacteria bacterium]